MEKERVIKAGGKIIEGIIYNFIYILLNDLT